MTTRITIRKPDDWHLHVRDGEMLKAVLPFTAKNFGRAILMPNLVPPVRTTADGAAYLDRVVAALPQGSKFVLQRMEKIGMPFLMHGEYVAPDVDIFDREAVFIDRLLSKWVKQFPGLRFILEHLSSKEGADFVKSAAPQVGGTITPYHMMLTRNDWLGHGLKPYMYVMPVIKTARDRAALRKAATSGDACYFLGTDSAPHPYAKKVSTSGIPGMFNAPVAIETYAQIFEEEDALDKFEAFASLNGAKHYRLPPNEETVTLEKTPWTAPEEVKVAGPDERALIYRGGETIAWKLVN